MFTGIIRHVGFISNINKPSSQELLLTVNTPLAAEVNEGDSVAVNGACLTVLEKTADTILFRLMAETLEKTNVGALEIKKSVNLERPLRLDQPLDGHFVQGHVDGLGSVTAITPVGGDRVFTITPPPTLLPYFIPKGSVTLDGVSLTVVDVVNDSFTVSIMPYTLEHTTFGKMQLGDQINIEVDMIGKYVKRFVDFGKNS